MASSKRAMAALKQVVASEKQEIGVILLYGLAASVLFLVVPIGVQTLVNNVGFGTLNQPVLFLILAVFAGLACAGLFRVMQVLVAERLQRRIFVRVAMELSYRIPRVRMDMLRESELLEKTNRFLDVVTVQKSAALLLLDGFTLVLQAAVGLTLLAFYHPFLLAFDVALLAGVLFVVFVLGRGALDTSIEESSAKYAVLAWLEEISFKNLAVRSQRAREFSLSKTNSLLDGYLGSRSRHFHIIFQQVVGSLALQAIASAALLGLGTLLVLRNQLALGQLVAAELVVTLVLTSFQKFQKHLESFYDLIAASGKLDDLLSLEQERKEGKTWQWSDRAVDIELVNVQANIPSGRWRLPPVSIKIESASKVAVLGSHGTGKSTLADIVAALKVPASGQVTFDGCDIRDLRLDELRSGIALVRNPDLFEGSLAENVRFGNVDLGKDEVRAVLKKVGLGEILARHSEDLDLKISGSGEPLSVGQARRVALARALASYPRVIVLDEWLDGMDKETTDLVVSLLFKLESTVVVFTSRQDIADRFSKVIELNDEAWSETA
ncbi:MAG: ATP-binding cassette domain-containing protein [Bdellovibrionales bacterium]|nr:ATP-binding cassette domain-containing protein [Bdellovibrionales bacterium]